MTANELPQDSAIELMEYIIENLVDEADQVRVTSIDGSEENVLEVRVAEKDVGKVIGKNGSVARALRSLLAATGSHQNKNYILEIID